MDKSVRTEALPRLLLPALSLQTKNKQPDLLSSCIIHFLRYHPDSDRGIKVLQTFALPLGDGTIGVSNHLLRTRIIYHIRHHLSNIFQNIICAGTKFV